MRCFQNVPDGNYPFNANETIVEVWLWFNMFQRFERRSDSLITKQPPSKRSFIWPDSTNICNNPTNKLNQTNMCNNPTNKLNQTNMCDTTTIYNNTTYVNQLTYVTTQLTYVTTQLIYVATQLIYVATQLTYITTN